MLKMISLLFIILDNWLLDGILAFLGPCVGLGWGDFEACQTWDFYKIGWVFYKFAENREFLIGRFLPYKLGIETPAIT